MFSTYAQKLLILQKKVSHKNSVCEQLRFLETELSHFEDNIYELKKDVARKLLNLESYNRPSVKNLFLKLIQVKGVVPKMALPILATGSIEGIYDAEMKDYTDEDSGCSYVAVEREEYDSLSEFFGKEVF